MTNWIAKTQGAMTIRPGTKYLGSSLSDTGAEFIEFVASTDDVALPEITHRKMRVWIGSDAHALALLGRPNVATTLSISDTGWDDASTGGNFALSQFSDEIPRMTADTTDGVTVSAKTTSAPAYFAADDNAAQSWQTTAVETLPTWWKVAFASNKTITSYSIRSGPDGSQIPLAPFSWIFEGNDVDTGDGWTAEDTRSAQTAWAVGEKRSFTLTDTGTTPEAWRYWRLRITALNGGTSAVISEIEMFESAPPGRADFNAQGVVLNASAIGSLAKATKRVIVDTGDANVEHSLAIEVTRGPVVLRCGSSSGDDDYINETSLGTGFHNLAFTPTGDFYVVLQNAALVDRIVKSVEIGDTGTVEITAPWRAADLNKIRYDQSADVVYANCDGINPYKIERRGTGRSWSVVEYAPSKGPFLPSPSSSAKMSVSHFFGNTTLNSDTPFFTSDHVGALVRAFHNGQNGQWRLGALDAATDPVEITGIGDTGTGNATNERRMLFSVTGTYVGTVIVERSFDGPDVGFKTASIDFGASATGDTGTWSRNIDDEDDNLKVWYRARMSSYTSGVAIVAITYGNGGVTGIARVTGYNSNTSVAVEVLSRFSDTGTTDNWQQGYWSEARGFPTAVALHGGRLSHAQGGSLFLTVSDDYENFDDETEGDAGPIIRTLGSGPVDSIHYLVSLLRLIIGTSGAEIALKSSSLDEPVTPDNSSAGTFSTQGSGNLRAVKMDNRAIFVQRSLQRVFMIGAGVGTQGATFGDYEGLELTLLVPDLLAAGVVSIAIQRQPDTRLHCVLADGTVAILTYEPSEEVICWATWETDGDVERAAVLPGLSEDAVFYHIRRTINGATKRYLEKWALESECMGDTGLSFIMDCAKSYTDTGRTTVLTDIATHLVGESVVVWGDDTGTIPGIDLSPGFGDAQTRYTVDTGGDVTLTLSQGVHHAVAGLPFQADWRSTKLAYGAEAGTALNQMKRAAQIGLVLYQAHNRGIQFGSDTGLLDALPQVIDGGAVVDPDKIFETFDQVAVSMESTHNPDARIHLRAQAPRPCTVLAATVPVATNERI